MGTRTGLEPAGRMRAARRATVLRAAIVAALLLTALAASYGLGRPAAPDRTAAPGPTAAHQTATADQTAAATSTSPPESPGPLATSTDGTARLPVPPGMVGVPVPMGAPPTLAMVRAGDEVDLLNVPDTGEPMTVAEHARVLGVDRADAAVLLALTPEQAHRTVAASGRFAVLIRS